jgi:hypothetical protein
LSGRGPAADDLLSFRDSLPFGLVALGIGCGTCGGSLAFLRSAVRAHGQSYWRLPMIGKASEKTAAN